MARDFVGKNYRKLKEKTRITNAKTSWIGRIQKTDIWKTVKLLSGKTAKDPVANLSSHCRSKREAANTLNEKLSSDFQPLRESITLF